MAGRRGNGEEPKGKRAAGEGSIGRRENGTYYATVRLEGKRRWMYGQTRKEVVAKLRELQAKAKANELPEEELTVAALLDRWLEEVVRVRNKEHTYVDYWRISKNHLKPALGTLKLTELRPHHIQRMLNAVSEAGRAPRTVRNVKAALRRALNQAKRWRLLASNPAELTETPRADSSQRHEPLSREELAVFRDTIRGHPLEGVFLLGMFLGMREGEILALRYQDVDITTGVLHITGSVLYLQGKLSRQSTKTAGSQRTLPIPTAAKTIIEELMRGRGGNDYLFSEPDGGPVKPYAVLREFRRLLKAAGLRPVRFHDLRHGAATMLLHSGVDPRTVADILGHSSPVVTLNVYAHALPVKTREAVERLTDGLL